MSDATVAPADARRVGRYELRRSLGSGAFGEVFAAFDPQLHREIALKVLREGVMDSPTVVERFCREARAAAKLKHPNIVSVHDAGADGRAHYIAAELIDGESLAKVSRGGAMDPRRAARIVAQIADAVGYAHRAGVVHRDIKPANVILDADDRPHLTDFGLAVQAAAGAILTTEGAIVGTPAYMAPEQAAGRFGPALPASDQYSVGAVLYELLAGRPPFEGTAAVVVHHVLHSTPPPPSSARPRVPIGLERICLRAMAFKPDERFPDCAALAAALREWVAGDGAGGRPQGRGPWLMAASALALAASLAVFAALKWTGPQADRSQEPKPGGEVAPEGGPLEYAEAASYLPLGEHNRRQVVDFAEVHGASMEEVRDWANGLGEGYVPVALGGHPTARPPRASAVAVKLTNAPPAAKCTLTSGLGGEDVAVNELMKAAGYRVVQAWDGPAEGPHHRHLLFWVRHDPVVFYEWHVPNGDFAGCAESMRKAGVKPYILNPHLPHSPGTTTTVSVGDRGRNKWTAEVALTPDRLAAFAGGARKNAEYVSLLNAYLAGDAGVRVAAVSWENKSGYDWDFKADMAGREYAEELRRRKVDGFRPVAVTSYGDPANPKYAASWVRFFYRTKPSRGREHE